MSDVLPGISQRQVWAAIAVAALTLATAEFAVRFVSPKISGNAAATLTLHDRGTAAAVSAETNLIVVGNSLSEKGFDPVALVSRRPDLATDRSPPFMLVVDSSDIWYWTCITHDLPAASPPGKVLVIGFAWDSLSDQSRVDAEKIFGLVCPLELTRDIVRDSGGGIEHVLEAAAGAASWIFALHADLRHRLLGPVIPDYERQTNQINAVRGKETISGTTAPRAIARSYSALGRMIEGAVRKGYRPVFVAMPVIQTYSLDPELRPIIKAAGGMLIDMRSTSGLHPGLYEDPIHLTPDGASILTAELAARLPRPGSPADARPGQ